MSYLQAQVKNQNLRKLIRKVLLREIQQQLILSPSSCVVHSASSLGPVTVIHFSQAQFLFPAMAMLTLYHIQHVHPWNTELP